LPSGHSHFENCQRLLRRRFPDFLRRHGKSLI
jgi:hypothetical protein